MNRDKIFKLFWIWDFDKEERWLNEMALQGKKLVKVGFLNYTFEDCQEGEYNVTLSMTDSKKDYIDLMKESGAEYIGSIMGWNYFARKSDLGSFDSFSDLDSKIEHLTKMSNLLVICSLLVLLLALVNIFMPNFTNSAAATVDTLSATLLFYALGRINEKKDNLKIERSFRE